MATTTQAPGKAAAGRAARAGHPASSGRFDMTMAALSALFLAGLWVDGWAHFHQRVDDSFFTPWHLVFYSAFVLCALTLGWKQWRGVAEGHTFWRALPKGYAASLIGVVIFGLGGAGDMVWHTLFGIEAGTEALLSPTHIMLGIGMALVFTGPARSAWARAAAGESLRGWRALWPMLASAALFTTMLMFFTSYAHPMTMPLAQRALSGRGIPFDPQDFGVTAILLEAGILCGVVGVLLARWRLPPGAIILVAGMSGGMLTVLVDSYVFLPPMLAALIAVELLAWRLKPSAARPMALIAVLAALPMAIYTAYFITIDMYERIWWSVHVWTGAIALAGVVGALVGWALTAAQATFESEKK
jgi:hypothetical protein